MAMWAFSVQWFFQVQCFLTIIGSVTLQVVLSRWQVWWLELTQLVRLGNETKNILNLAAVETIESPALPVNHFIVLCTQSQLEHMQWTSYPANIVRFPDCMCFTREQSEMCEREFHPCPTFQKVPAEHHGGTEITVNILKRHCVGGWKCCALYIPCTESTYSTNFS